MTVRARPESWSPGVVFVPSAARPGLDEALHESIRVLDKVPDGTLLDRETDDSLELHFVDDLSHVL